ncbi:site-2 protease family protein [Oligoflexia bacterium]|nr:site-2 protease family protein [Oligoflexia bacterium]
MEILLKTCLVVPPLFIAMVLHEIAHALAAEKCGDQTARNMGRVTLNPIKHIDPVMTIALPALLIFSGSPIIFGGAKPVPVNPAFFKNPKSNMGFVAAAGPVTNVIIAAISFLLFVIVMQLGVLTILPHLVAQLVYGWLLYSIIINIVLCLFNLLPVPPLDGGRIAVSLLPMRGAQALARLEPYGLIIIVALLYFGIVEAFLGPVLEFVIDALEQWG